MADAAPWDSLVIRCCNQVSLEDVSRVLTVVKFLKKHGPSEIMGGKPSGARRCKEIEFEEKWNTFGCISATDPVPRPAMLLEDEEFKGTFPRQAIELSRAGSEAVSRGCFWGHQ